jgi:hypothetical protein
MTPKQERFVSEYLKTGNASAAYRAAYSAEKMKPTTVTRMAHDLLKNRNITAMLSSHQKALQKRTEVTLENLTSELEKDRELAREKGQMSAAISASKAIGDLHGLQVEPRKNERPAFEGTTTEQLEERLQSELERVGYTVQ